MHETLALLAAGVLLGLGIEVARALLTLTRHALDAVYHAARWYVYRPLVRRYYLARSRHDAVYRVELHAAMAAHPSSNGRHLKAAAEAHNRALS